MGGLMEPAIKFAAMKAAEEAAEETKESERLSSIRNIMETLHLTAEQAMNALKIPANEQPKYAALI